MLGSIEEYAFYFELAFPDERDRRTYLDRILKFANPSYGHFALAGLLKMDSARVIWTTNFDRAFEDAAAKLFGTTSSLTVVTLGESDIALDALNEGRWPILGKLHGDFLSRRLKNTPEELRVKDERMHLALRETCTRMGLAVIGYSGRDTVVIESLRSVMNNDAAFPGGLFWFHRLGSSPSESVQRLISDAKAVGVDANLIQVETFDELFADVLRMFPAVPEDLKSHLDRNALRVSDAPLLRSCNKTWPVVRLNAIQIAQLPTVCRIFSSEIGGFAEVRDAIEGSGAAVVATRRNVGVLAFGSDAEVKKAFGEFSIRDWDLYSIEPRRMRYESQEHGLVFDALIEAISRERPLQNCRRRSDRFLVVDSTRLADPMLSTLLQSAKHLVGIVPGTQLAWAEAARIRLEYKLDLAWLLIEPTIWIDRPSDDEAASKVRRFRIKRLDYRYNSKWNDVLNGWIDVIVGKDNFTTLSTFEMQSGVNAEFTLGKITAFSRRER